MLRRIRGLSPINAINLETFGILFFVFLTTQLQELLLTYMARRERGRWRTEGRHSFTAKPTAEIDQWSRYRTDETFVVSYVLTFVLKEIASSGEHFATHIDIKVIHVTINCTSTKKQSTINNLNNVKYATRNEKLALAVIALNLLL